MLFAEHGKLGNHPGFCSTSGKNCIKQNSFFIILISV